MGKQWDEKEKQVVHEIVRSGETDPVVFRTKVEQRTAGCRTFAAYHTFLYKQSEQWTDIPQLLMSRLYKSLKEELDTAAKERAERAANIAPPSDDENWLTAPEAAEKFGITAEQVRRRCVLQKLVRRIESADGQFLYSERDLTVSGHPMRRRVRRSAVAPTAHGPSAPSPAPTLPMPVRASLGGDLVDLSVDERTVVDLARLLRAGVLTREQVADALTRIPTGRS